LNRKKKEEERDKKIYDKVLKEYKEEKTKARLNTEVNPKKRLYSPKSNKLEIENIQLPKIKISEKKTQAILEEGGMLDAYKHLVIQLCKNGLPTGNLFEYSAIVIRNYEKKWKEKKSKMNKDKLEQYWKEKKAEVAKFEITKKKTLDNKNNKKPIKDTKEEENKIKALNRSLEHREINKLIQSMDRSRSSRNHQDFGKYSKKKNNNENNIVSVQQQEGKNDKNKKGNQKGKSPSRSKSRKTTAKSAGKSPAKAQKKGQAKKKK